MMKKRRMTGLDQWVGPSFVVQVHMYQRGIANKTMKNIMIAIPIGRTRVIIHISMIENGVGAVKYFLSLLMCRL
jgi:hypothetical protein